MPVDVSERVSDGILFSDVAISDGLELECSERLIYFDGYFIKINLLDADYDYF